MTTAETCVTPSGTVNVNVPELVYACCPGSAAAAAAPAIKVLIAPDIPSKDKNGAISYAKLTRFANTTNVALPVLIILYV
jgi:hypothetical protein